MSPCVPRSRSSTVFGVLLAILLADAVGAQVLIPGDRPSDERLERPELDAAEARPAPILPPYPIPQQPDRDGLEGGLRVQLDTVRIEGNTVLPEALLEKITAPYLGRPVQWAELLELRDRISLAFVDRGYRTSGATIPQQTIRDGVLRIRIVEGRLSNVEIETDGRYLPRILKRRIRSATSGVPNVLRIEAALQRLQRDRKIERVEAQLIPQPERGVSVLKLVVEEAPPVSLRADIDNARSPAIGSYGGSTRFGFDNALGIGDSLWLRAELSEGLRQFEGNLSLPVSPWETLLSIRFQWSAADIVEEPIDDVLDIATRSRTFSVELRQPFGSVVGGELESFLRGELRRSKSTIDGVGVGFVEGPEDGESKVSVLRWGVEWTRRGRSHAIALRSLATVGLEIFDATSQSGGIADGQFLAWLGQGEWAQRLPWWNVELVARGELQLTNSRLLPLEQTAIGGRYTVRGFRENVRVGDNGWIGSLEARIPIYSRVEPRVRWDLIPFVDSGAVWNAKRGSEDTDTLTSVGLGTRLSWDRWLDLELFWGHSFEHVERSTERDLQDSGIHFRLTSRWP